MPTIVLGELRYGIARLPDGRRKNALMQFWNATRERFTGRTFPFDVEAAACCGDLVAKAERAGRSVKVGDGQIAAIALSLQMSLATKDVRDFEPTGVALINPWEG